MVVRGKGRDGGAWCDGGGTMKKPREREQGK